MVYFGAYLKFLKFIYNFILMLKLKIAHLYINEYENIIYLKYDQRQKNQNEYIVDILHWMIFFISIILCNLFNNFIYSYHFCLLIKRRINI